MHLLTTYTNHSELQVITALSKISTLYISPQHLLSLFLVCCVFISRSPATASNSGDYSASCAHVLSSQPPVQNRALNRQLTTNWIAPIVFLVTTLHGPSRKRRFHSNFIVDFVFVAAGTCVPISYLETGAITLLFIRLLHSNGCTCTRYNIEWDNMAFDTGSNSREMRRFLL
jgi:hypothetical protein